MQVLTFFLDVLVFFCLQLCSLHLVMLISPLCTLCSCMQVVLGYLNEWPHDIVLLLANAMGAATATHEGAGQNVGKLHEVLNLLEAAMRRPVATPFTQAREWHAACREALVKMETAGESQSSQDCLGV